MVMNLIMTISLYAGIIMLLPSSERSLRDEARGYVSASRGLAERTALHRRIARIKTVRRQERMQRELTDCLSYIKNLVIVGRGLTMSGVLMLEELAAISRELSPVFLDMAASLHICDEDKAATELYRALPFSWAKDIGAFLAGWENIAPEDLLGSIEIYMSALREERLTVQKRRDEMISDLVYFPVVVNAMAVLLNFIYVAYFIEQREILNRIFI